MGYRQYTTCCQPKDWQSMAAYVAWAVGPLTAVALPFIVTAGWCIPFWLLVLAAAGVVAACDWWLNVRLVCLGGDEFVVGMIVSVEPSRGKTEFFGELDTDYSINLCVYPNLPGVSQAVAEASVPYGRLLVETQSIKDNVGFFRGECSAGARPAQHADDRRAACGVRGRRLARLSHRRPGRAWPCHRRVDCVRRDPAALGVHRGGHSGAAGLSRGPDWISRRRS